MRRRYPVSVHLTAFGEDYVLNRENVFCLATRQADGRTWYSYGGKLNAALTYSARHELASQIRRQAKPLN